MEKAAVHPYIPIALGILTVGFSAVFVKLASADAGVTAFYRMFLSVVIMLPIFVLFYRNECREMKRKDWLLCAAAGVLLAIHFVLWFESLHYTSVASSTVLVALQPIFALAGTAVFFKEKVNMKMAVSVLIALAGSFTIGWQDFQISGMALFGDALALAACLFVTAYLLIGQDARQRLSLITYTFIVYSVSSAVLFLYVLLIGESFTGYPASDWLWFLALALLPNLLGHTLFNWAVKWVSTNIISVAILFEPVLAAAAAYFILDEKLYTIQLIGGSVVLTGILLFVVDAGWIKKKLFHKKA